VTSAYENPELMYSGAYADIYRVSREGKYFLLKAAKDRNGQEILRREFEMSSSLSHPYIASVFVYEKDTPVGEGMVMEYVDGRNLLEYLSERPSLDERKRVFLQLLDAVSYIHRSGRIHNDIKPSNILISRKDNDVKLIDFGLADSDAYFMLKTLGFTASYASPELISRDGNIDARSDIYSLGCIGKDIFKDKFSGIVRKCLQKDKEKRYRSVDSLKKTFVNYYRPLRWAGILAFAGAAAIGLLLYVGRENRKIHRYEKMISSQDSVIVAMSDSLEKAKTDLSSLRNKVEISETKQARVEAVRDSLRGEVDRIMYNAYSRSVGDTKYQRLQEFSSISDMEYHKSLEVWRDRYEAEIVNDLEIYSSRIIQNYMQKILSADK